MSSFYIDRRHSLDDRLIDLVRQNPAIYDVNHKNYRRNQVRLGIWHKIAKSLGAPSKFVQTKWKNIRYNYLQDLKQQQNGNSAVKRRKSTRDLSFLLPATNANHLKEAAKQGNVSDNESNSYIYQPENNSNCFEIVMIEPSEDGSGRDNNLNQQPSPASCFPEEDKKPMIISNTLLTDEPSTTGINIAPSPEPSSFSVSPSQSSQMTYSNGNGNGNICRKSPYSVVTGQQHNHNNTTIPTIPLPPQPLHHNSDPIEMYCLSLADALRAMSRAERERVKYEFANILKDAKYKDNS